MRKSEMSQQFCDPTHVREELIVIGNEVPATRTKLNHAGIVWWKRGTSFLSHRYWFFLLQLFFFEVFQSFFLMSRSALDEASILYSIMLTCNLHLGLG